MYTPLVRLCYRKIIDAASAQPWDKYVFDGSYAEYLLQVQYYDPEKKYGSFNALLQQVPKAAKLHFLVSAAVTGYLQQLGGTIPDIKNNLGLSFLSFSDYRFEIIESDNRNKAAHRVAINFYSHPLYLHQTPGNYLLLSKPGEEDSTDGALTHLLALQPMLSIYSLKQSPA